VTGAVIRLLFAGELLRHRELLLAVAPYTGIGHGSHEFLKELIVRLRRRNEIADRETGGTGPETAGVQYCELLREVDGIPELFIKLRLTLPLAFGGHRGILMLERACQP
jgi:hypothetical protein